MKKLLFYLFLPILFFISRLPFWALYAFSDFLYLFVFRVIGYRREVVNKNLRQAFPEKSAEAIKEISREFYQFFCDMSLETLKMWGMSPKVMKQRIQFSNLEIFEDLETRQQSFILMLGHYGSWEWGSAAFELYTKHHILVIYKPLSNPYFDKFVKMLRTRFGQEASSMKNTLRNMLRLKKELTATAFIADQRPDPRDAYWTSFLGKEAGFFRGTAKIAQKLNYPIVYCLVRRPKRGYYLIEPQILVENPKTVSEDAITQRFVEQLEHDIREAPSLWLWSHDRWKHQRPEGI